MEMTTQACLTTQNSCKVMFRGYLILFQMGQLLWHHSFWEFCNIYESNWFFNRTFNVAATLNVWNNNVCIKVDNRKTIHWWTSYSYRDFLCQSGLKTLGTKRAKIPRFLKKVPQQLIAWEYFRSFWYELICKHNSSHHVYNCLICGRRLSPW